MKAFRNRTQSRQALSAPLGGPAAAPAALSFTITLILFSIQLFFIKPYFPVNDDIYKVLMAKGIGPAWTASPYVGYSNVLMGYLLKWLFARFPLFPWYGAFLCLAQFLALWAFFQVLCPRGLHRFLGAIFFIGLWAGVYFIFFTFLQFTITAALCAQAGILLFCLGPRAPEDRCGPRLLAGATGLIGLSALIRLDALLLTLLVSLPLILSHLWGGRFKPRLKGEKPWLAAALLLVLGLWASNTLWFRADADWKDYERFDRGRVEMQDYRIVDYEAKTKPLFDSVGWSRNDLWLFKNWFLANPVKFNAQTFEKLEGHFPRWGTTGKIASFHSLGELLESPWDRRILWFALGFLFLCPAASLGFLSAQLIWVLLLLLALIYGFRAPDRVTLPILVYLLHLTLYFARLSGDTGGRQRPLSLNRFRIWAVLASVFFLFSLDFPRDYYLQNIERQKEERELLAQIRTLGPRDNQLYIVWDFPFEWIGAFNDLECFRGFHLYGLNFSQTCPAAREILKPFQVGDPFRDLVDNPRLFLVCSPEKGGPYHDYLKENYGLEMTARREFTCDYFKVFSVHSSQLGKTQAARIK